MREPFVTALLVRNEADRYLREVLDWHGQWGPCVVLDDGSDDGTPDLCRQHPSVLRCETRPAGVVAWGTESPARAHLWNMAEEAGDWVLVADADQLLSEDPRPLCQTRVLNAWSFVLYDLWDEKRGLYREDQFWRGHLFPRPWLFNPHRTPAGWRAQWSGRGIHTGHCPANFPLVTRPAPAEYYWLHLGYARAEDRLAKLAKYRSVANQMSPSEIAHAESIADPNPTLRVLPFAKPIRILIGGPVRKRAPVLQAHLDSLAWQEFPKRVQVSYCFVDDYPAPDDGQAVLRAFVDEHGGEILRPDIARPNDFTDQHPVTHQWTQSAMNRMGELKTLIFRKALEGQYDYVWLVDSDLILDRTTLRSLLSAEQGVVSAVYWTKWNSDPGIHSGPQVWLRPPYQLGLPHYDESTFRKELAVDRKLVKVGGLGACTLIHRSVIEKGVNFAKPPAFPSGGLMDGEDRHFCEWARRLHVDLWADAWPDIFHIYHPSNDADIPQYAAELGTAHPQYPNTGSLLALKLTNLEDGIGPVFLRTRLGLGSLLPEIESALYQMTRGQTRTVKVHFPSTAPNYLSVSGPVNLAGQTRLIQVELVDCKTTSLAPVVRDEFYVSPEGVSKDAMMLTPEQRQSFQDEAEA